MAQARQGAGAAGEGKWSRAGGAPRPRRSRRPHARPPRLQTRAPFPAQPPARAPPRPRSPPHTARAAAQALLDTVLVLAIVAGTSGALFGVNVLLTDVFNAWYAR